MTPSQSSFTSGNFRGVTDISSNNLVVAGDAGPTYNLPVGNGFMFYFRGNLTNPTVKTTSPYAAPESTTFTNTGTLNNGNITVKDWFTPTSANLSFTTIASPAPGNGAIKGYNLVGNPYPSSISWTLLYGASTAVSPTIYEFNPMTNQYGAYVQGAGSGTNSAGDIIASGEGFFVVATSTSAAVNFTEAVKSSSQPSTLLLASRVNALSSQQYIHLKLIKDSINYDDVIVGFKPGADSKYLETEDAIHLAGNSPPETLTALSSDNVGLSVNYLPLPGLTQQTIALSVSATASGTYQLSKSELVGIPAFYEIWLKDNLLNDSLDMRANTTYAFNIDNSNPATFGANRFQIVIRQNPSLGLHLLAFNASKTANGAQVQVNWTVENEASYTTFNVQRSTDNGITFQSIGGLQSENTGSYTFTDQHPLLTGQGRYRLQLTDVNNVITYSGIVVIEYSDLSNNIASNIALYPNPTRDVFNLSVTNNGAPATSYTITITNSTGYVVKTLTSSQSTLQSNVSDLMPGTYFVSVVDNNKKAVGQSKFVKL